MSGLHSRRVLLLAVLAGLCQFAEAQSPGRRVGFGRASFDTLLNFVRSSNVRNELKITEEQFKQLGDLRDRLYQDRDFFQRFRDASDEEREKLREEQQKTIKTEIARILSKDQFSAAEEKFQRKQQLDLQRQGLSALERGSVERELGLSDEQQDQIRGVMRDYRDATSKMLQEMRDQPDDKREEIRAKYRAEWEPKFMAVLSAEQQKKWKDMLGPPADRSPALPGLAGGTPTQVAGTPRSDVAPDDMLRRAKSDYFDLLDRDKDGKLSKQEWERSQLTRASFERGSVELAFRLSLDDFVKKSRKVDAEVRNVKVEGVSVDVQRRANAVFPFLDKDKDGSITPAEWEQSRSTRSTFKKAGVTLTFPISYEDFSKKYQEVTDKLNNK